LALLSLAEFTDGESMPLTNEIRVQQQRDNCTRR
jgi:hypothetical protein